MVKIDPPIIWDFPGSGLMYNHVQRLVLISVELIKLIEFYSSFESISVCFYCVSWLLVSDHLIHKHFLGLL